MGRGFYICSWTCSFFSDLNNKQKKTKQDFEILDYKIKELQMLILLATERGTLDTKMY